MYKQSHRSGSIDSAHASVHGDARVPGERKVSVIIPAYNDAEDLEATLKRLREIREREYKNLEIVVAVRRSNDGTDEIAAKYADIVVPGGKVNNARNSGAQAATGDVFIFLDADSMPSFGVIPEIEKIVTDKIVGTCTAYPSKNSIKARATVSIQNFARRTRLIRGMSNLFFCHASLFRKYNVTYNENRNLGEHHEHIWRARREAGAHYVFLNIPRCYQFAVDRYERVGYFKTFRFWVRFFWTVYIMRRDPKELEEQYWSQ